MDDINLVIAKNICEYRKQLGLTQAQLGEKLNFTDKSVSKWEKGEYLPEISVLYKMCELFGVTLNDLTKEQETVVIPKKEKHNKILITLMSAGLVWFIATIAFVALIIFLPSFTLSYLCFIYALPISAIVLLVFSCVWGNNLLKFCSTSFLSWTILLSICLTFSDVWYLFLIGAPFQILISLWFYFKKQK